MEIGTTRPQQPVDAAVLAGQQQHWAATFDANPDMYGTDPSAPGLAAAEAFAAAGHTSVLELGAGQGRDTLFLARQGLQVTALDYAPGAVESLSAKAQAAGLADLVTAARHDIRQPLPLPDYGFCWVVCQGHLLPTGRQRLQDGARRQTGSDQPERPSPIPVGASGLRERKTAS